MKKLLLSIATILLLATTVHAQTTIQPYVQVPYWQSDSGSYTFIGISHPSLTGMASQVGLRLLVVASEGTFSANSASAGNSFYSSTTFTVSQDQTKKMFIVTTNHATVNVANFPTAHFVATTSGMSSGQIRMYPIASNPDVSSSSGGNSDGTRALRNLSMWGMVIMEASGTGFAMEFIGDLQSSKS